MSGGNSYNGWPANSDRSAIGVNPQATGAGVMFPGGIKAGDVEKVLGYVADQLHARVEPVTENSDGTGYGCWGYTYKQNVNNPSSLSCHASGTAIDWIAPSHPNGSGGTFSNNQVATIYAILAEVQGGVDWLEGYDEMHFEIAVSASTLANIAATLPAGSGGGGTTPTPPTPTPEPEPEDDMPRRILTIYGGNMEPLGQALDGPTGVIVLNDPAESAAVQAVIDNDEMVNQAQVDIYNNVLARSNVLIGLAHRVWDDHFENTPGGGSASTGDILSAIYDTTVTIRDK